MDDIVIVDRRIERAELARLVDRFFGRMVKLVVDVQQGNRSMEIEDPAVREAVRRLAFELVGEGEAL